MDERSIRISEAIEKSGYSYTELAKLTGISKSSLQRYATGETKKIPIDCIEKIAEVTHTDSRYLMCWEKEPSPEITDSQLKFALFGDVEIDDDVLDDVKRLAKLHMELRKQEKNEKK